MRKMEFDDIKQLLLEAVDEVKTVEELIELLANRIYEKGFQDGVESCKRKL